MSKQGYIFQQAADLLPQGNKEEKASYLNNASSNFHDASLYQQAFPLYQQALDILINAVGKEHPDTQIVINNYQSCVSDSKRPTSIFKSWLHFFKNR